MTLQPLVTNALLFGVLLSATLFTFILVLVRLDPEIMLRDYPPDVQAKNGPMSDRAKRRRIPAAIVVLALLLGVITASLSPVLAAISGPLPFPVAFAHFLIMFSTFNLLDLLVLDWLVVVTIRPRFLILPGTEGMAGYRDYGFHFRGFIIGIPITLAASLGVAGLATVVY